MYADAVNDYLAALGRHAATTRKTYRMALGVFGRFAAPYGDDPAQYPPEILSAYRLHLQTATRPPRLGEMIRQYGKSPLQAAKEAEDANTARH